MRVTPGSSANSTSKRARSTCAWSPGGVSKRSSKRCLVGPEVLHRVLDGGVAAGETALAQLSQKPNGGQARIGGHTLAQIGQKASVARERRRADRKAGGSRPRAMYLRTVLRSRPSWRAIAVGLSPCRCNSRIITSSPSRTTESLPPAGGAVSTTAPWVRANASWPGTNAQRNEVGNFQRPLMGRIHPPLTPASASPKPRPKSWCL